MALWGRNDNKFSGGTVSLEYGTKRVTGTGTSFGQSASCAAVGDVISFGDPFTGAYGYHGDAVITSIQGELELTIDSTSGLSHGMIENTTYRITQSPKSATHDPNHNQMTNSTRTRAGIKLDTKTNHARVAVGSTVVFTEGDPSGNNVAAGDIAIYGFGGIPIGVASVVSVGSTFFRVSALGVTGGIGTTRMRYHAHSGAASGASQVTLSERFVDRDTHSVNLIQVGDTFQVGLNTIGIGTIVKSFIPNRIDVILDTPLIQNVAGKAAVEIERGIAIGTKVELFGSETAGGKEATVIGIGKTGLDNAANTSYALTSAGWVGITTYTDTDGNDRVKTETLVAMSGIATGIAYPPV